MCPPNPVLALAALDISIRDSWSDEELVRFLAERKAEDPLPQDVLVGLDFSVVDPQAFTTGDVWYMSWSDDQQPYDSSENGIRKAQNGYWKPVDSSRIPTSTTIIGVKIILEFFEGEAPCGRRTGWVMHEYKVEQNDEANLPQDYKSLCKVFPHVDKKISASRHNSQNAYSPKDSFGAYLQYIAKIEEPKQTVDANEQDISSSKGQHEQSTQSAADYIDVHDFIATEDYIELNDLLYDDTSVRDAITLEDLNDLLTPEASASTSEYSSKRSMFSEEYLDLDAFLREILKDSNTTDGQNKDHKFSIAAPTKSANVVISPSEQGLVQIHDNNATVAGTSQQKQVPGGDTDQHSSSGFQHKSPISSCLSSSHVNWSRSYSSQSSIRSQREWSSSKVGKIVKKYCCFGSFQFGA